MHHLRADMTVSWLLAESVGLAQRRFCRVCAPSGPVSDVRCVYCADGPLLSGVLAGADPATDPGIAGWLLAQGWHLEPVMSCPRCVRAFGRWGRS